MRLQARFWAAFWAGLAAPVGLFAAPPAYPVHSGLSSVASSFATVGAQLSRAASQTTDDAKRGQPD